MMAAEFEIRPNCSGGPATFAAAAALVLIPAVTISGYFIGAGVPIACVPAWTVAIALLWALAVDRRRRVEAVEFVRVLDDRVLIHDSERHHAGEWLEMSRDWLRIERAAGLRGGTVLHLVNARERYPIARHLSEPEHVELAKALNAALRTPNIG